MAELSKIEEIKKKVQTLMDCLWLWKEKGRISEITKRDWGKRSLAGFWKTKRSSKKDRWLKRADSKMGGYWERNKRPGRILWDYKRRSKIWKRDFKEDRKFRRET